MSFERRWNINAQSLTTVSAWSFITLASVTSAADKLRVKGVFIKGIYWVQQTTEVVTQYGSLGVALLRFPDTVSTPDPDWALSGAAPDSQILNPMVIHAAGQNNPVLFTFKYRALNVRPGEKMYLALRPLQESGASINHRVNLAAQWVQSDD